MRLTAIGIAGLIVEVHDRPAAALSDGANALPLSRPRDLWTALSGIDGLIKSLPINAG